MDKWIAAYTAARYLDKHKNITKIAEAYLAWINSKSSETVAIKALLEAAQKYNTKPRVIAEANQLVTAGYTPTVASADDVTGGTAGGETITLTGTHLLGTTGITFGGTAGTAVRALSDTQVQVTTPAKTAGADNVVVTTSFGSVTKTNFYTYS